MPFDLVTWKAKVVVEAAQAAGAGASGFGGWCAHDSGGIQRVPPLAARCAADVVLKCPRRACIL
ncbi:MAG: hypothetical protein ACREOH_22540 [Candidatus Entotheonellia bacterium]